MKLAPITTFWFRSALDGHLFTNKFNELKNMQIMLAFMRNAHKISKNHKTKKSALAALESVAELASKKSGGAFEMIRG